MIYPKYKTFQLLIPMLKEYNIRHIVISPGSRMREFVIAVEEDPFFTTFDVTDERSASYFAMGISQELNVPVVIVCTSSTATTNYVPGVTEAFYQNVPIVVLTGDRDPYMLGQQEDQMINQVGMYDRVVRKSVTLPIVKDDADKWYCQRLLNEALLELDHKKKGPVHINVPVPAIIYWNNDKEISEYPKVNVIRRYCIANGYMSNLRQMIERLSKAKKILVFAGQNVSSFDNSLLERFFAKYNCCICAEHMGNVKGMGVLNLAGCSEMIPEDKFGEYVPEIVISFHGTIAITRRLKEGLRTKHFEHWLIDEAGEVVDAYKNLNAIFECSPMDFFKFFIDNAPSSSKNDLQYYDKWHAAFEGHEVFNPEFSNVFAIKNLLEKMPAHSNLHLSILNSIRISQYYSLPEGTKVYANVGTDGIDGCMSTFFGQAAVTDKECFLIIGDLSFFYDMSSLRIKHNRKNCHIMLINNHGGNEFYQQPIVPTTPQGLGASHGNNAKAWAESVGFKYLMANDEQSYYNSINVFVKVQETPVLFEVFTDQMIDRKMVFGQKSSFKKYYNGVVYDVKDTVKSLIGDKSVSKLKNLLGKNKS